MCICRDCADSKILGLCDSTGLGCAVGTIYRLPNEEYVTPVCDESRHLICSPYNVENLHLLATTLGIKRCWFHKNHYDIPKMRIDEIKNKCVVVSSKSIVNIIKGL